jgi:hypothetical protein
MRQVLLGCLLVLGLLPPAFAGWESVKGYALDDPLARRIACTGTLEDQLLGPKGATVSIFSVPEPDGSGERLFVGLVDEPTDRGARVRLWRGPVAVRWKKLGPMPGYKPDITKPNPARYQVNRLSVVPGRGVRPSTMEIDLECSPPMLWLLDGRFQRIASQPLGESLKMNRSLWLLARLSGQRIFTDGSLTLRAYEVYEGSMDPEQIGPGVVSPWDVNASTCLLAVCKDGDPNLASLYFLPKRPFGWKIEKLLAKPSSREGKGRFVLQIIGQYGSPDETGELAFVASRHRAAIGLDGLSLSTMDTGLVYNSMNETWVTPKALRQFHAKTPAKGW